MFGFSHGVTHTNPHTNDNFSLSLGKSILLASLAHSINEEVNIPDKLLQVSTAPISSIQVTTTEAPSLASTLHVSRPMPLLDPGKKCRRHSVTFYTIMTLIWIHLAIIRAVTRALSLERNVKKYCSYIIVLHSHNKF